MHDQIKRFAICEPKIELSTNLTHRFDVAKSAHSVRAALWDHIRFFA